MITEGATTEQGRDWTATKQPTEWEQLQENLAETLIKQRRIRFKATDDAVIRKAYKEKRNKRNKAAKASRKKNRH